jgi:hypothetical protein
LVNLETKYVAALNLLEKQELTIQITENELQSKESELELNLEKQDLFKQNAVAIKHNTEIDIKIKEHKTSIDSINDLLKTIATSIKQTHGKIEVAKTNKKHAIENLEKVINTSKKKAEKTRVHFILGQLYSLSKKYELAKFVDHSTSFISDKFQDGQIVKALELPGLWNGSMSGWNSVFVEVPSQTFHPVKTVNDLLRAGHK